MPFFIVEGITPLAPAAYVGPGDIASFAVWGGLRAYSAAKAAAQVPCIRICSNQTDFTQNPQDINVMTSGALDTAAIATYIGLHGSPAYVFQIYDQVGSNNFVTQFSKKGSPYSASPVGLADNGTDEQMMNSSYTTSQPFGISLVAYNTTGADTGCGFCGGTVDDLRVGTRATNLLGIYAGGASPTFDFITQTGLTTGAFHACQVVLNGASSKINVDGGSDATGNPGAFGINALQIMRDGNGGSQILNGYFREIGVIAGATSINSSLTSNMKSYWGIA